MKDAKGITINIMGRELRVAAPEGEERQLLASVEYLNKKIKEIRDAGKVVGNERIAIMAALNIAHEHLQNHSGKPAKPSSNSVDEQLVKRKMIEFEELIEKAISDQEKLF
jgi:cell division protein ZapA